MISKIRKSWTTVVYWHYRLQGSEKWIEYLRRQGVTIGERCRLLNRDLPSEPYLVRVGNHVTITNGCRLVTHDGAIWLFRDDHPAVNRFGRIDIRDNCFIGLNSIILPGVTIGENSVVAAGSVVASDVPPNSIVGGVPAKVISDCDSYLKRVLVEGLTVSAKQMEEIKSGKSQSAVMEETLKRDMGWNAKAVPDKTSGANKN